MKLKSKAAATHITRDTKPSYPYLANYNNTGLLCLVMSRNMSVVVRGNKYCSLGETVSITDNIRDNFIPWSGTVKLKQRI